MAMARYLLCVIFLFYYLPSMAQTSEIDPADQIQALSEEYSEIVA